MILYSSPRFKEQFTFFDKILVFKHIKNINIFITFIKNKTMSKIKIHNEGVSKFVLLEELETGELWVVTDKNAEFHEEVYKRFARK